MIYKFYTPKGKSKKYPNNIIIHLVDTVTEVEETTGVKITLERSFNYIYIGNDSLKNLPGNEVKLTLVKSPKLGFNICTKIELVDELNYLFEEDDFEEEFEDELVDLF